MDGVFVAGPGRLVISQRVVVEVELGGEGTCDETHDRII